jgi:type I restriction enzyme S subunit
MNDTAINNQGNHMNHKNQGSDNIPKLRFPEFKGEWEKKKLGEISDLITKGTTPSKFINEGVKFIKIECFDGDKINQDRCLFIDEKIHNKELKRSILKENDLLFAIAGATIGKVNFVTKEILPANTNQALAIVRLKERENRNYVYQILKSNRMQKYIIDSISVGAQPNLNLEQMNNFSFFYPTLPEQTRIASFFTVLDKKIAQLKQKKILLEQYKKGVMQKLFSQELRFKPARPSGGDENGNEFPKWEKKKLGEVVLIKSGLSKEQNVNNTGHKVTRIETISDGTINLEKVGFIEAMEEIEGYKINKGDILFSNINSVAHIGKTAIAERDLDLYHGMNLLCLRSYNGMNSKFIFYSLNTNKLRNHFKAICNQAVSQASINQTELAKTVLQIPSPSEQTKIANFLSAIDEKINRTENQIQKTQEWKKGLLQRMFV